MNEHRIGKLFISSGSIIFVFSFVWRLFLFHFPAENRVSNLSNLRIFITINFKDWRWIFYDNRGVIIVFVLSDVV